MCRHYVGSSLAERGVEAPKYQDLLGQLALLDTHALAEIEQIKTDIVTNRAARKEDAKRLKATLSATDFAIWEKQAIGKNLELKAFLKYKKELYEQLILYKPQHF